MDTWQNQMNWADELSVTFGSNTYTDWRLPITFNQSCFGYNCTNSEMGHLYYTELGNKSRWEPGWGLTNTEDFQNLLWDVYWSSTEDTSYTPYAWHFVLGSGQQGPSDKGVNDFAIAVRPGDVTVVPEPISSLLFVIGGALFGGRCFLRWKA